MDNNLVFIINKNKTVEMVFDNAIQSLGLIKVNQYNDSYMDKFINDIPKNANILIYENKNSDVSNNIIFLSTLIDDPIENLLFSKS